MAYSRVILLLFAFMTHALLHAQALAPAGTIQRTTKQQLLASIPPSHETTPTGSSQLVLTSPSGKYAVFLLRRETSYGAGGFGSDFCYVQVQDSGESVWESECTPVSNVNTCSLVFSDAGLEIFDGSRSAWNTDVEDDDDHLETLVLVDTGDMRINNKDGDLKWKASDNPIVNQNCGSIGAPEQSPAHPPFGSPIGGGRGPFGKQVNNNQQLPLSVSQSQAPLGFPQQQQQQQLDDPLSELPLGSPQQELHPDESLPQSPLGIPEHDMHKPFSSPSTYSSLNQPFGVANQQPLVDNTPFDSGCSMTTVKQLKLQIGLFCLVGFLGCFF